jgi:gas vesicle protein
MENEKGDITKGLFLGFLAGGIVGAVVALLYAPKPGRELRRDIRDQKDKIVDKASELLAGGQQAADEFLNAERDRAKQVLSQAKDKAQSILANAEHTLTEARTKASGATDAVRATATKVPNAAKAGMDAFRDELKKG